MSHLDPLFGIRQQPLAGFEPQASCLSPLQLDVLGPRHLGQLRQSCSRISSLSTSTNSSPARTAHLSRSLPVMSDTKNKSGSPTASLPRVRDDADQPGRQDSLPDQLEVARRFLQEEHVKASSRAKKTEFLQSKGLRDSDIEKLLEQEAEHSTDEASPQQEEKTPRSDTTQPSASADQRHPQEQPQHQASVVHDRPPIVTYPEFLIQPDRPPPLVTKDGILSTLYGFAGLSTLLYGTSKFLIAPMVETTTDARSQLYHATAQKLDSLVAQLEKTVSVIPSTATTRPSSSQYDDAPEGGSDDEDPTEMFHRDIGTQTSSVLEKAAPAAAAEGRSLSSPVGSATDGQTNRLTGLTKSLAVLRDQLRAQSEGFQDVKTMLDVFRDSLDGMTYSSGTFVGGYDIYGSTKKKEPEDEIRKVRDNIRRLKGLLLSTRTFPVSAR
ncbi:hypothetical protein E4U16_000045 [Claviceps sp. LM84 group G4]|nr:hypothetical protein E4U16_000045 [Claviceps sp. LM84 group G4]